MVRIDRNSPIPLYFQIAADLRHRIGAREWAPGEQLPTEQILCADYEVSHMTMHQAMSMLAKEGVVIRQRGSGTYVSDKHLPIVTPLTFPVSFAVIMRQLGLNPSHRLIQTELIQAPPAEITRSLNIPATAQVACFKRILEANEQALALNRSFVSLHLCPGITEHPLIEDSMSATLTQRYHLSPVRAEHWLEAMPASENEEELLGVEPMTPMLVLTTLSYIADGTPLEFSISSWVGDRMRVHIDLHANSSNGTVTEQAGMGTR